MKKINSPINPSSDYIPNLLYTSIDNLTELQTVVVFETSILFYHRQ